jgi:hypothetical protein
MVLLGESPKPFGVRHGPCFDRSGFPCFARLIAHEAPAEVAWVCSARVSLTEDHTNAVAPLRYSPLGKENGDQQSNHNPALNLAHVRPF